MAHYFTREAAEALLPRITVVLRKIQEKRRDIISIEKQIGVLRAQSMGNGHHLYENVVQLQRELLGHMEALREALEQLQTFGCELKDPDMGLIDFLSLREGREIYLCWHLGEERIAFWHDLDAGFAGRQRL